MSRPRSQAGEPVEPSEAAKQAAWRKLMEARITGITHASMLDGILRAAYAVDFPKRPATDAQAVARLVKIMAAQRLEEGGVKVWADARGISATYLRDIVAGRRPMSDSVAESIGLVRVHGWREAK